jgi:hypothetical protein
MPFARNDTLSSLPDREKAAVANRAKEKCVIDLILSSCDLMTCYHRSGERSEEVMSQRGYRDSEKT